MSTAADESAEREAELRTKRICRMCLTTEEPLSDLYSNENRLKSPVPLPLQIMSCVSLEVSLAESGCDYFGAFICRSCWRLKATFARCERMRQSSATPNFNNRVCVCTNTVLIFQ